MHDGRFTTLKQVLEHYNSGVQRSAQSRSGITQEWRLWNPADRQITRPAHRFFENINRPRFR
jgi:hypothetical protein